MIRCTVRGTLRILLGMGTEISHSLRRARQGNPQAFAQLIEGQWCRLTRLARSVVGEAQAEDAVQDGLILAWQKLSSLKSADAFSTWLTRIVLRNCLNRVRRTRSFVSLEDITEPSKAESPNDALDIERLLGNLAPRQRAVMHLTIVEGLRDSEIAHLLGIRSASVRSHRRRARQLLIRLFDAPVPARRIACEEETS